MKLKLSRRLFCFAIFWYQPHTERRAILYFLCFQWTWIKVWLQWHNYKKSILWGYNASNISYGCGLAWCLGIVLFFKEFYFHSATLFLKKKSKIERAILKIIFVLVHMGSNRWRNEGSKKRWLCCAWRKGASFVAITWDCPSCVWKPTHVTLRSLYHHYHLQYMPPKSLYHQAIFLKSLNIQHGSFGNLSFLRRMSHSRLDIQAPM